MKTARIPEYAIQFTKASCEAAGFDMVTADDGIALVPSMHNDMPAEWYATLHNMLTDAGLEADAHEAVFECIYDQRIFSMLKCAMIKPR